MPTLEQPNPTKWSAVEDGEKLRITLPGTRSWLVIAFLVLWLSAWTYGGLHLLLQLFTKFQLFGLFFMAGWAVVEYCVAWGTIMMIVGKEVITASSRNLEIHWEAFGKRFLVKQYAEVEIRKLRFQPARFIGQNRESSRITFNYRGKTVAFGASLPEPEADQIIRLIRNRCPTAASPSL